MSILDLIYSNNEEAVLRAIDKADLSIVDDRGDTPLHFAVASNNISIVRMLLKKNIDVNAKNHDGKTALHYAVDESGLPIIQLLIENGISTEIADNHGNHALWSAVFNAADGDKEKLPIVELLLKQGADKDHKNNAGKSPLDFAKQVGLMPLIEVLKKY